MRRPTTLSTVAIHIAATEKPTTYAEFAASAAGSSLTRYAAAPAAKTRIDG